MAYCITQAKRERVNYDGAIYHITTRCNNQERLIKSDLDFRKYKLITKKSKEKLGFLLYNYCIMNNHVHIIVRLIMSLTISKVMHSINGWYARWYNAHYNRKGHFWEDRFYAELIRDDVQLLAVMRYMDLNPVRAGLCKKPTEWKYSGARFYLEGEKDELIDIPDVYINLEDTIEFRRRAYSNVFPVNLTPLNLTRLE